MPTAPNGKRTPAQIALGVFVVWQLVFLVLSNAVAFFPHGAPEIDELSDSRSRPPDAGNQIVFQPAIEVIGAVTDRWAHLTGQIQAWWLFAPEFPPQATFPLVELRWEQAGREDGPPASLLLQSALEPADSDSYQRLPGSFDRLFHYQVRMGLIYTYWDDRFRELAPWSTIVEERIRRQWRSMRAYLRSHVETVCREHPSWPRPSEAILWIRIYRTPQFQEDGQSKPAPVTKALARWRPGQQSDDAFLPIEMCDPITSVFAAVKRSP